MGSLLVCEQRHFEIRLKILCNSFVFDNPPFTHFVSFFYIYITHDHSNETKLYMIVDLLVVHFHHKEKCRKSIEFINCKCANTFNIKFHCCYFLFLFHTNVNEGFVLTRSSNVQLSIQSITHGKR